MIALPYSGSLIIKPALSHLYGQGAGVQRLLDNPFTGIGADPAPTFQYVLDQGDTLVPEVYGETLTKAAGTDIAYNQGSCFTGPRDDSTRFTGTVYNPAGTSFGNLSTDDFIIQALCKINKNESEVILAKYDSKGFYLSNGPAGMNCTIRDSGGATVFGGVATGAVGGWDLITAIADRNGFGAIYRNLDNGASFDDISAFSGSLNDAVVMSLGNYTNGFGSYDLNIAMIRMWQGAAWLDSHLQATWIADCFALLTNSKVQHSWLGATLATTTLDAATYLYKEVSGVTTQYKVGKGHPRICQKEVGGITYRGLLNEGAAENVFGHGSAMDGGTDSLELTITATDGIALDGTNRLTRIVETAATSVHYLSHIPIGGLVGEIGTPIAMRLQIVPGGALGTYRRYLTVNFNMAEADGQAGCVVDLQGGVILNVGRQDANHFSLPVATLTADGSGGYVLDMTVAGLTGGVGIGWCIAPSNVDTWAWGNNYAGDPTTYPNGFLVGAGQIENDSVYCSSQIDVPSTSAVTRPAGVHAIDITGLLPYAQGTIRGSFLPAAWTPDANHAVFMMADASGDDWISLEMEAATGYLNALANTGGSPVLDAKTGSAFNVEKVVDFNLAWKANNAVLQLRQHDSATITTVVDTSCSFNSDLVTLFVGSSNAATKHAGPILVGDLQISPDWIPDINAQWGGSGHAVYKVD